MNQITIASYNLKLHRAYGEISEIARDNRIDVFCLQECKPDKLEGRIGNLTLAGVDRLGSVGLAIYYNKQAFSLVELYKWELTRTWYERTDGKLRIRQQISRLKSKKTNALIQINNLHLAHLLASNKLRRSQMRQALINTRYMDEPEPTVIVGDLNYPIPDDHLRDVAAKYKFSECGQSESCVTYKNPVLKGRFDRVFVSRDIEEISTTILPFGASDHAPVMTKLRY